MSRGFSSEKLELVTSMADVAPSEREDLGELDREDENRFWVLSVEVKAAVAYEKLPSSVPPGGPHPGEMFEPVMIGDPDGLTLLLQKFILSKVPADPQSNAEYAKLSMAFNLEVAKIARDKDATERLKRLMERLKGN